MENNEINENENLKEALKEAARKREQHAHELSMETLNIEKVKELIEKRLQEGKPVKLTKTIIELGLTSWFHEICMKYEGYYRLKRFAED